MTGYLGLEVEEGIDCKEAPGNILERSVLKSFGPRMPPYFLSLYIGLQPDLVP